MDETIKHFEERISAKLQLNKNLGILTGIFRMWNKLVNKILKISTEDFTWLNIRIILCKNLKGIQLSLH